MTTTIFIAIGYVVASSSRIKDHSATNTKQGIGIMETKNLIKKIIR